MSEYVDLNIVHTYKGGHFIMDSCSYRSVCMNVCVEGMVCVRVYACICVGVHVSIDDF